MLKLKSKGTDCLQKTWKVFEESNWTPDSKRFDFLIMKAPPESFNSYLSDYNKSNHINHSINQTEIAAFAASTEKFVKRVGYVIVFLHFDSFPTWYRHVYPSGNSKS